MAKFDPSQPFESVKFDPSKPFESSEFDAPHDDKLPDVPDQGPNPSLMAVADDGSQGPSLADASPQAQEHQAELMRRKTLLGKAKSLGIGVLSAAPFKEELGAAAEAAMPGNGGSFLERYRASKKANDDFWKEQAQLGGGYHAAGSVIGSIPPAIASAALPGGPIAQGAQAGAAAGLDASGADLTRGEGANAATDTAIGGALGAGASAIAPYIGSAVGKIAGAIRHPVASAQKAIGEVAQLPQKAIDYAAEKIGNTSAARKGFGDMKITSEETKSPMMQALQRLRDRANPAEEVIAQSNSNYRAPNEQAAIRATANDAQAMARSRQASAEKAASDPMAQAERNSVQAGDAQAAQAQLQRMSQEQPIARAGAEDLTNPQLQRGFTMQIRNEGALKNPMFPQERAYAYGADADKAAGYNAQWKPGVGDYRMNQIEKEIRAGLPGSSEETIQRELNYARGMGGTDARNFRRAHGRGDEALSEVAPATESPLPSGSTSVIQPDAKRASMHQALLNMQRSPAGRSKMHEEVQAVNDMIAARGGQKTPGMSYVDMVEGMNPAAAAKNASAESLMAGERLESRSVAREAFGQSKIAGDRLSSIARGREVLKPVMGAMSANALGGPLGAAMNFATGSKLTGIGAADFVGNMGNRLSEHAMKTLNQPGTLQKLSGRNDAVGMMAKWASSGDPAGLAARIYSVANNPAMREALKNEKME